MSRGMVEPGLPKVSYFPPVVVTLLSAVLVLVVLALLTLLALLNSITQFNRSSQALPGASTFGAGLCGVVGLMGLAVTLYFVVAVWKGIRDLTSTVYYTRGTVRKKRTRGGRVAGHWVDISARYVGPDISIAGAVSADQRAASPDRALILEPRSRGFMRARGLQQAEGDSAPVPSDSYLPAGRISGSNLPPFPSGAQSARGTTEETGASSPHLMFRVDPAPFQHLEPGDEVLVAHSRFLQHIFYVAHLRGGDWESFRNRALI